MELAVEEINSKIYEIRDMKVMLDRDLAQFYGVETRRLKEQVKRNIERFPDDFMFQLTDYEVTLMVSQNAIPSKQHLGGSLPFAFTEQGVSMLSAVLKSKIAVEISIKIMRTFTALRKYALTHDDLAKKIEDLENRVEKGEQVDKRILDAITRLITDDKSNSRSDKKIGFI
ncbi:MAG: ORF6N domain-containing protein [Campylobacterota bacterium]|nr:ORF6N domain-containing protein [Campylobacterota bacterium]